MSKNTDLDYYIKGAISGMFGISLSHPVDNIKTHMQIGNNFNTFKFNIRNLYKGLSAPLLGVGFEKALVFGTYNYCLNTLKNNGFGNENGNTNFGIIPLSGAIAGLTASLVVSPYERFKILKQCSQTVTKKDLSLKFLYKGLSATFTREVPGFAIYFSVYEGLKAKTQSLYGRNITYLEAFMFGGLSGMTAWIFIYPQDRIKTILQSSYNNTNTNTKQGFSSVMREIYAKGGIKYFYSGFSWAVCRAMLLHSGTFCMMEILNNGTVDFDMSWWNVY